MKLIILDRDGVINEDSEHFIKTPAEWIPLPGSLEAISLLCGAGFRIVVATNQSGIARRLFDPITLEAIHQKMHNALKKIGGIIDHIFYCPHGPQENCLCRKPKPGLLYQAAEKYKISLANVPIVGDSLRDLEAAQNAGATPILVLSGNGRKTQQQLTFPVACFDNLWSFAYDMVKNAKP